MSVIQLVLDASPLVQVVMGLLLLASVISWAIIVAKLLEQRQVQSASKAFEKRFWAGGDLAPMYKQIHGADKPRTGMESIFESGFGEFARLRKQTPQQEPLAIVEGAQRAMKVAYLREMERLDGGLSMLATIGSSSPYVGLFGTVWGIMNSFIALGSVKQATIAMVAPHIAEALIATAMGLFAAIPAVIAYNKLSTTVDRLDGRYEAFMDSFAGILQRHSHGPH